MYLRAPSTHSSVRGGAGNLKKRAQNEDAREVQNFMPETVLRLRSLTMVRIIAVELCASQLRGELRAAQRRLEKSPAAGVGRTRSPRGAHTHRVDLPRSHGAVNRRSAMDQAESCVRFGRGIRILRTRNTNVRRRWTDTDNGVPPPSERL